MGMEILAPFLEQHQQLMVFDVSDNRLGDRALLAIATVIQHNTVLQALYCEGNTYQGRALPLLAAAITTNGDSKLYKLLLGVVNSTAEELD